ncbi:MAG: hypothetical protein V1779_14070 [bacterium]
MINQGEYYFIEYLDDRFLHTLHAKKYCCDCYEKHGDSLLIKKSFKKKAKRLYISNDEERLFE